MWAIIRFSEILANSLYIGPFRNAINVGSGTYYDLNVGTDFVKTWNAWKTGDSKHSNRAIEVITQQIRSIFEFSRLEINASTNDKLIALVDGQPYRLDELGAGLSQFIVVFANAAIKKPTMILIDEPELNLHPALQI